MTREDIIAMARKAELIAQEGYPGTGWLWGHDNLERFAALVAAAEREACAMEAWALVLGLTDQDTADIVLRAIRARGEK